MGDERHGDLSQERDTPSHLRWYMRGSQMITIGVCETPERDAPLTVWVRWGNDADCLTTLSRHTFADRHAAAGWIVEYGALLEAYNWRRSD
jgi:hypothetical protein